MAVTLDLSASPLIRDIIDRGHEEALVASLQRVVNRVLMDRLGIPSKIAEQMTDFLSSEDLEAVLVGMASVGHAAAGTVPSPRPTATATEAHE